MEPTHTHLEETQRLNSIISVLLEQIATLKRENAMLKTGHDIKNNIYTSDKNGDIMNNPNYDHPENIDGTKNSINDYPGNIRGINNINHDYSENIGATNNSIDDFQENINGINNTNHQYSENIGGINNENKTTPNSTHNVPTDNIASITTDDTMPKQNTDVPGIAPAVIEPNTTNINMLASYVKRCLHTRVPNSTCDSVAAELLFIHNNGTANGHELRRAAGLSIPGFAKHLPMIKRRDLVYKKGVKKYALTQSSIELINKAFGSV